MTLRYKLITNKSEKDNKEIKDIHKKNFKNIKALQVARKALRESGMESLLSNIDSTIKRVRGNIESIKPNTQKQLHVYSDKQWKFYHEFENTDFGITSYKKEPVVVKVDTKIPVDFGNNKSMLEELRKAKEKSIAEIKRLRQQRKSIPFIEKEYHVGNLPFKPKYKVYKGGGFGIGNNNYNIHMEAGEIMRLKEETKLRKVFEDKKPLTDEHHVGVEIEFICKGDKYAVAKELGKMGVENFVTLKDDGSLRAEEEYKYTHELCVIAPQSQFKSVLKKVIDALDVVGSRVNKRCGLHVHIDVRHRDKDRVFANLVKSQDILYAMNPNSRLTGTQEDGQRDTCYSKKVTVDTFKEAQATGDRYLGINSLSYARHNTIEVRIHSGSTNFTKIFNWVAILMAIADKDYTYKISTSSPEKFVERFGLDDTILAYIKERIAKFNKNGKHITVSEVA